MEEEIEVKKRKLILISDVLCGVIYDVSKTLGLMSSAKLRKGTILNLKERPQDFPLIYNMTIVDENFKTKSQEVYQVSKSKLRVPNILFMCQANIQRSPTAEKYFKNLKSIKGMYEIRSSGVYARCGSGYYFCQHLVDWADKIYVMDLEQAEFLYSNYQKDYDKVEIIGVSDQYDPDSPQLLRLLYFWFKVDKGGELF